MTIKYMAAPFETMSSQLSARLDDFEVVDFIQKYFTMPVMNGIFIYECQQ